MSAIQGEISMSKVYTGRIRRTPTFGGIEFRLTDVRKPVINVWGRIELVLKAHEVFQSVMEEISTGLKRISLTEKGAAELQAIFTERLLELKASEDGVSGSCTCTKPPIMMPTGVTVER